MLSSTVIIATRNRPTELSHALRSLLLQTRLPEEVIVVDDGNLPGFPLDERFRAEGVRTRLLRKSTPGLTGSRVAGIASLDDILFTIGTDVWNLAETVRIELRDAQRSVLRRRWNELRQEALEHLGTQAGSLGRSLRDYLGGELEHLFGGLRKRR